MPIAATPDYHYHHPSLQNYLLGQSKPPRPLQKTRTYSMITSTVPSQPRPFITTPNLSQPLQTIHDITCHFRTTMDQSKFLRPLQTTRTYFMTTSTVPNQPKTFLITPYLFQPVQIINAITRRSIPTMESRTTQCFIELSWLTETTITLFPTLFQVYSDLSWLFHAYCSISRPSLP